MKSFILGACLALAVSGSSWQGSASRQGTAQGADGVTLFYRQAGSGPPAVLLHGGPGSNINGVWPDLQPLGAVRTVTMYDQRGGGRSQIITDAERLTATHHVRDLEALRLALGLQRFALIGESWGAGLAALYAAEHPDRVERLVLIGPMPPTRTILERRLDESDAAMGMRKQLEQVRLAMPSSADPIATCRQFFSLYSRQFFVTPDGMSRRRGSSCDGPAEGVRNYFVVNDATFASLGEWDFRPLLTRLTMPALVIEGEQSIPSTVESARVFAQSLPNATLVLVPGAGHYPQVEQPKAFFDAVVRFLTPSK
jgi:proline iminopeptidase